MSESRAAFRILVVDDEPFSRKVVAKHFESLGAAHVVFASSAAEAKAAMAADPAIRLVISDHYMPGENGIQLLGELRQGKLPLPHDCYFVVATASTSFVITAVALSLHADSFLSKPFSRDDLARRLHQFLSSEVRPVKTPEFYRTLDVPAMLAAAERMDPAAPRPAAAMKPLGRVIPGTELASNLVSGDGHLILPVGTPLTRHLICRLTELGITEVPVGDPK